MVITQKHLIDDLADSLEESYSRSELRDMLNELESIIVYYLKQARLNEPIIIKPFGCGLQLISKVLPADEIHINGSCYRRPQRLRTSARLTKYFRNKIRKD